MEAELLLLEVLAVLWMSLGIEPTEAPIATSCSCLDFDVFHKMTRELFSVWLSESDQELCVSYLGPGMNIFVAFLIHLFDLPLTE